MADKKSRQAGEKPEVEITEDMIEAGASAICAEPGAGPCGLGFSPPEMAKKVYQAMEARRREARDQLRVRNRVE